MPTYRLDCEYEGTRYRGWQEQQNARSVAGELKRAATSSSSEARGEPTPGFTRSSRSRT